MNMEINDRAPAQHKEEVSIAAPVERVYGILSDIEKWTKWRTGVDRVKITGVPTEGKPFTWRSEGLNIKSKLHTVKENKAFGWTGKIFWINAVHNWYFDEDNGGTKVTVKESLNGFGAAFMKKSLIKTLKKDVGDLKSEAERK